MGDLLQISPQELKFRFELKRNVPVTLSLTNTGSERVAFKVRHNLVQEIWLTLSCTSVQFEWQAYVELCKQH